MTTGTYTGSYGSIVNSTVVSFTITSTGIVSGAYSPAAVIVNTGHTLTNFGKVTDTFAAGVELKNGGAVINGSLSDTSAYINGYSNGVSILGATAGTVTNFGTIQSTFRGNGPFGYTNADYYHNGKVGFDGIYLRSGGVITNSGAASDIYGWAGVETFGGSLSITNAGTIAGYSTGIYLLKGSTGLTLTNSGLIHSRVNEAIMAYSGNVAITNTGTVLASGTVAVYGSFGYAGNRYPGGIYVGGGVAAGATITNGSATNSKALIQGYAYGIEVYTSNAVTITNWATIAGVGTKYIGPGGATIASPQLALSFTYNAAAADRVVDEAGATFVGLVEGGGAASVLELASPSSTGTISGIGTQFLGFGTIAVDTGATWNMTGANTIATETVRTNSTHPTLVNAGTIKVAGTLTLATGGALTNTGVIDVGGGEFLANIGVGNAGSFQVGTSGRIDFASSASTGTQIDFLDATGKLILGTPSGVTLGVTGFVHGDEIDLPGVSYDTGHMTATYAGGQLSVYDNGVLKADIHVTGLSAGSFTPANDGGGGTEITPACYCRGTLVLTDRGEVAVEDLTIGDRLVTRDGTAKRLKWIGRRSYVGWLAAGNPKVLPVCFKPGSLADGVPKRELWMSPEHAIYLDEVLVPAELLVNGSSILKAEVVDEVHYFHLELDAHDVILAEGAWAESFVDDDSRGMFHNAAEYKVLYPEAPLHPPALYCAPRLEEGFELEALRRRLAGRGQRLRSDGTAAAAAALEGHLDLVRHDRIEGWARDPAAPGTPVVLMVLANGAEIGRVVADRYRDDLLAAGIGDGVHAFELVAPGGLAASWPHTIEVCRADQWTTLPGSPVVLQPAADDKVLGCFAAVSA